MSEQHPSESVLTDLYNFGGGRLNPDDSTLTRPAKESHNMGRSDPV